MTETQKCLHAVRFALRDPQYPEPIRMRLRNTERAIECYHSRKTVEAKNYLIECLNLAKSAIRTYELRQNVKGWLHNV